MMTYQTFFWLPLKGSGARHIYRRRMPLPRLFCNFGRQDKGSRGGQGLDFWINCTERNSLKMMTYQILFWPFSKWIRAMANSLLEEVAIAQVVV